MHGSTELGLGKSGSAVWTVGDLNSSAAGNLWNDDVPTAIVLPPLIAYVVVASSCVAAESRTAANEADRDTRCAFRTGTPICVS